jgi:flagellar protein FliO/FliZ
MFLSAYNSLENILQLVGIFVIFLIILAAAYAASVLVGKSQGASSVRSSERNMKLIETMRLGNNQLLQIVQIGSRYYVLSVTKEHVELIAEVAQEELNITDAADISVPFHDVLEKMKAKLDKKQKNDKSK